MSTHRALVVAASLLCAGSAAVQAQDWSTIRIATEGAYAPWNFQTAAGDLAGFEIDLAADLCARMEAECEIVQQAWDGIIPALQAGRYDAIMAGMSITDARREVISFSRAYVVTPGRFVVTRDSPFADFATEVEYIQMDEIDDAEQATIETVVETFRGNVIGVQTATTHENFLREYLGDDVDIRSYDTQENLDLDLQAGRIDAALASMGYWVPLLESDAGQDLTMVGPAFAGGPFGAGVGVGIRQADTSLVEKFDEAITAALEDGTISALAEEWFGFDSAARD
jgi:octopine/nopaline transport system substrate-binding protein